VECCGLEMDGGACRLIGKGNELMECDSRPVDCRRGGDKEDWGFK